MDDPEAGELPNNEGPGGELFREDGRCSKDDGGVGASVRIGVRVGGIGREELIRLCNFLMRKKRFVRKMVDRSA